MVMVVAVVQVVAMDGSAGMFFDFDVGEFADIFDGIFKRHIHRFGGFPDRVVCDIFLQSMRIIRLFAPAVIAHNI